MRIVSVGSGTSDPTLVDTSVAVALSSLEHPSYVSSRDLLSGRTLGLSGHAAFETYSTLTRMPPPLRRSPADARAYMEDRFPASRWLGADIAHGLIGELVRSGIAGGSVWDALVGACARAHGLTLASRDGQARPTYDALGVDLLLLP